MEEFPPVSHDLWKHVRSFLDEGKLGRDRRVDKVSTDVPTCWLAILCSKHIQFYSLGHTYTVQPIWCFLSGRSDLWKWYIEELYTVNIFPHTFVCLQGIQLFLNQYFYMKTGFLYRTLRYLKFKLATLCISRFNMQFNLAFYWNRYICGKLIVPSSFWLSSPSRTIIERERTIEWVDRRT